MTPLYQNGRQDHEDAISTFVVHNHDNLGEKTSATPGWEIIFGGQPEVAGIEIQIDKSIYSLNTVGALVTNAIEPATEYYRKKNRHAEALGISHEFLVKLMGASFDPNVIRFSPVVMKDSPFYTVARNTFFALRNGVLNKAQVEAATDSLAVHLLEQTDHNQKSFLKYMASQNNPNVLLREILNEIHQNYLDESFSIERLAESLGVSKFHLIRTLKEKFQCTPYAYIRKLRLHRAEDLLMNSKHSVMRIAMDCGFNDADSLNKAFKSWKGYPPSRVRG